MFNESPAVQLARRGYRMLMVNYRGGIPSDEAYLPTISRGIAYLRTLPGVTRVVVVGHSGGGHLMAFYENVAEHGPAACKGPEKIYPCQGTELDGLQKPDGMVLLDPTLGAFHQMSSVDPAVDGNRRNAALDMFTAANGYDLEAQEGELFGRFRQALLCGAVGAQQQDRRRRGCAAEGDRGGKGKFTDDEPLVIPGMGVNAAGARLYQPDLSFVEHTKKPHMLLKADGTNVEQIVHTVRPPSGQQAVGNLDALDGDGAEHHGARLPVGLGDPHRPRLRDHRR